MYECRDSLIFLHKRAEQLYAEGNIRAALRLIHVIDQVQCNIFEQTMNLLALERVEC